MLKLFIKYSPLLLLFVALHFVGAGNNLPSEFEINHSWIQIAALGVSALGSVLQGASQRRQARELEAQNQRPVYTPSPQLAENRALALQQSRVGLPEQVYNNQLNQIQQNFATGLRQIGLRGNTAVNANSLVSGINQSVQNLNALDAQARQQGTLNLMQANTALSNERRGIFQDQLNQYMFNAQNVASMRRAGTQNIFGGLGMLAQGAMMGTFNGNNNSTTQVARNTVNPNTLQPMKTAGVSGLSNQGFNIPTTIPTSLNPFRQF